MEDSAPWSSMEYKKRANTRNIKLTVGGGEFSSHIEIYSLPMIYEQKSGSWTKEIPGIRCSTNTHGVPLVEHTNPCISLLLLRY
jgi:hypothetical protein